MFSQDKCKIFVGNIPYNCKDTDFSECFKDIPGFLKAEIIISHRNNLSRGFGFVTMADQKTATDLMERKDIFFKGRQLRFTTYQFDHTDHCKNGNNYAVIGGLPVNTSRDWVMKKFEKYGPINRCFIYPDEKGNLTNRAFIDLKDDTMYKRLLDKKLHPVDNHILDVAPYQSLTDTMKKNNRQSPKFKNMPNRNKSANLFLF